MSEIFRKLRIKQMHKGEIKRYLIFGIAEVFLLVAGILIALSISNWDSKKSKRSDELKIYENISNMINEDREEIDGSRRYNDDYLGQFQFADQIIRENDRTKLDTLVRIAINLSKYSDFNRNSNVYQNLLNSGELKLLKNTALITMLQELEQTYIYLNRIENIHLQFIMEVVIHDLINSVRLSTVKAERPEELYSFHIHNFFIVSIGISNEKNEVYQRAIKEIDKITQLIDEEMNQ